MPRDSEGLEIANLPRVLDDDPLWCAGGRSQRLSHRAPGSGEDELLHLLRRGRAMREQDEVQGHRAVNARSIIQSLGDQMNLKRVSGSTTSVRTIAVLGI